MANFVEVPEAADIGEGAMRTVSVSGRELLIARVSGRYFAVEGRCPHLGGKLAQGKLLGTVVTCPLHGSQFDLSDGRVIKWTDWTGLKASIARVLKRPRSLRVYQVRVENGRLMVKL